MKKLLIILSVVGLFPVIILPQSGKVEQAPSQDGFRLKQLRPYVYLEVDHIGPRKPWGDDEPKSGIWLYLHNNCKVPIIVLTSGVSPDSNPKESGVIDNVVANPTPSVGDGSVSDPMHEEMQMPSLPGIFGGPVPEKAPKSPVSSPPNRKAEIAVMPRGYMSSVSSFVIIGPGQSVYFSLPLNHVSKTWHFEVPFRFALKQQGPYREPESHLAFFWDDLPEAYRTGGRPRSQNEE
jgi:hypothetical protein